MRGRQFIAQPQQNVSARHRLPRARNSNLFNRVARRIGKSGGVGKKIGYAIAHERDFNPVARRTGDR